MTPTMKKEGTFRYLAGALILVSAQFSVYSNSTIQDNSLTAINSYTDYNSPIVYVDTRVGTAMSETKTAGMFGKGSEEHGQTVPAVGVPNGMNMWVAQTQDTEQKCIAPYYYADDKWQGFRNSHWVNGGRHRIMEV